MRKESWKEREREKGEKGEARRGERERRSSDFFFGDGPISTGTECYVWFQSNQESVKRYAAKGSKQRPFKLPEALATNDRGKDWDVVPPDPVPDP